MKKLIPLLLIVIFFAGCKKNQKKKSFPEEHEILNIVYPLKLNVDTTLIFLQDYVINPERIDSITFSNGITQYKDLSSAYMLKIVCNNAKLPIYSLMNLWIKNNAYTILLEKSDKITYNFTFDAQSKNYAKVSLAGDFNNWNPSNTTLKFNNGLWQTKLTLSPGVYQYLIVADDTWMLDFNNKDSASNNMGGFNSILKIEENITEPIPYMYSDTCDNSAIGVCYENKIDDLYVFWENFLLEDISLDKTNHKIIIKIPEQATLKEYSCIRIFASNSSGKANDLMIPLKNGKPILNPAELTRMHKQAQVYYFLLVDRFNDGDEENNETVRDAEVSAMANFMGGDLIGITQKMKEGYFDSLSITTLWLSPLVQNPLKAYHEYPEPHHKFTGYHGYWPVNSTSIDYRFGSEVCLKELVETAHTKNINVILDFVANHVHEDNPIIKKNPQWATKLELEDGLNIRKWDEHRLTTWFDKFLPSLDFSQNKVVDTIAAIAVYWVKKYGIDGFRHDATKHIPLEFWRNLTLRLKKDILIPQQKNLIQIGETFGSRELIGSYVGSGLLDGQFDFNLYFDARAAFCFDNEPFSKATNSLNQSFKCYGYNSLMGNITGNHDLPRFTSLASGDLKPDENAKEVAWKRKIQITDTIGYYKMAQFFAFNICIPGIPVIYYGDEIGMAGADDPDNRRYMKFDNLNHHELQLKQTFQKLISIKRNSLALNYGSFKNLLVDDKQMVFMRNYFDEYVLVFFNKDMVSKTITLDLPLPLKNIELRSTFNAPFEITDNKIKVNLSPCSFEIIKTNIF